MARWTLFPMADSEMERRRCCLLRRRHRQQSHAVCLKRSVVKQWGRHSLQRLHIQGWIWHFSGRVLWRRSEAANELGCSRNSAKVRPTLSTLRSSLGCIRDAREYLERGQVWSQAAVVRGCCCYCCCCSGNTHWSAWRK